MKKNNSESEELQFYGVGGKNKDKMFEVSPYLNDSKNSYALL